MEDLQEDFNGPCARSIAAELRDNFYLKLVDDFLGPQTGDFLALAEKPCTNRLLIQVALMKEENDIPWANVVNWLQKIFPKFDSVDFHCLIERNTETALSLKGDARESFLASDVNFEFVGPICDRIGIGRTDLLEISDFSDRVKLTDVTNGLILELTSFIAREKIDPVVLVLWLRNFDSSFCSDGKIQRANKLLQASLQRFREQYRNSQRTVNRSSGLFEEFLQSQFEFIASLDEAERQLRRKRKESIEQESTFTAPRIKEESEPFDISEQSISPRNRKDKHRMDSCHSPNLVDVKQEYDPESMWSEREPAQNLDSEETSRTDTGDCVTLLDTAFLSLQKLTGMYGGKNDGAKKVSMDLLKSQFSLMLSKDADMKSLKEKVMAHFLAEDTVQNTRSVVPVLTFLQCNTHFLFDFVDAVEKQIMSFEREIVSNTGDRLGRDKNVRFRSFVNFDESAVTRYISMTCKILCPREETGNSYRRHWLAFCIERNNPSTLPVNQSNRFINYFEAAAGLVHHHKDVALFVSDLQQLNDDSNIVLDSINDDATDEAIQTLVCVVAVVYCKVLGPFWQLLKSDAQYMHFSKYIYSLYKKLLEWSEDVSALLQPEATNNVFRQVPLQEKNFSGVFMFCQANIGNQFGTLMRVCLQRMMKVLAAVIEEDLKDFLPGGQYCREPSAELAAQLAGCTFSQLMGEYPFGHTYSYKKNRPDKTRVHTEASAPVEAECLPTPSTQVKSGSQEVPVGPFIKTKRSKPYIMFKRATLQSLDQEGKKKLDQDYRKKIIASVAKHGGPCKSVQDVERLLMRLKSSHLLTREAIRWELNYQKILIGVNDDVNHVGFSLSQMISKLKSVLPFEKRSASIISTPTANVVIHVGNNTPDAPEPQEEPIGSLS